VLETEELTKVWWHGKLQANIYRELVEARTAWPVGISRVGYHGANRIPWSDGGDEVETAPTTARSMEECPKRGNGGTITRMNEHHTLRIRRIRRRLIKRKAYCPELSKVRLPSTRR
jgi:hypothetical protein